MNDYDVIVIRPAPTEHGIGALAGAFQLVDARINNSDVRFKNE